MKIAQVSSYLRVLLRRGPWFCISNFLQTAWFDLRHRTDTHMPQRQEEYSGRPADFEHGIWYVCSRTDEIHAALGIVRRRTGDTFRDFQFFDLGAGKGKSILVYCLHLGEHEPRHRPGGIEYDPCLVGIARENLERMGFGDRADIFAADARSLVSRCTSPRILLFLYNPFDWSVLGEVVAQIADRETMIIYIDPKHEDDLVRQGFVVVHRKSGREPNRIVSILHRMPRLASACTNHRE